MGAIWTLVQQKILPDRLEVIAVAIGALSLVILFSLPFLLVNLELSATMSTVLGDVDQQLRKGLAVLSNYGASAFMVTFLVWCLIGFCAFILIQLGLYLFAEFFQDVEDGSAGYIHPSGFSTDAYWFHRFIYYFESVCLMIFLGALIALVLFLLAPLAVTAFRVLITYPGATSALYLLTSWATLTIGLLSLVTMIRFLANRAAILDPEI